MILFPRAMAGNGFKMSHKILSKVQMAQTCNQLNSIEWVTEHLHWLPHSRRSLGLRSLFTGSNQSITALCLSHTLLLCRANLSLPPSHSLDRLVCVFPNISFRRLKSSIFLKLTGKQILNLGLHNQLQAVCFMSKPWTKMNARAEHTRSYEIDLWIGCSGAAKKKYNICSNPTIVEFAAM